MRSLLQEFAVDKSLAKVDSCIIIIGSHGGVTDSKELFIHGCDFGPPNPLLCDEIINLFNSDICTLRRGCPKIFIFQACRFGFSPRHASELQKLKLLFNDSSDHQFFTPLLESTSFVVPNFY